MKRGFLLKAQERKAAARRRALQNKTVPLPPAPIPQLELSGGPQENLILPGFEYDKDHKKLSTKLPYGPLTEEDKGR